MYLTPTPNHWIIDIETDDLNATKVWCVVAENVMDGSTLVFGPDGLDSFADFVRDPTRVCVGHNLLSFDAPTLNRLLGTSISRNRIVDTLVLSYLYNPKLPGGHSLEAWGKRLKQPKAEFNDFSRFSPEMLEYCKQDVKVTKELYLRLTERMRQFKFTEKSCEIEHGIRDVINKQQAAGFFFDVPNAQKLRTDLLAKADALRDDIHKLFPRQLVEVNEYDYKTKKDGEPYESFFRHIKTYDRVVMHGDKYKVYNWRDFNINSPVQRIERLMSLDWKPEKFTAAGNPQVDEESLLAFYELKQMPEIKAIADYLVLSGRASMIGTWLDNVGPDSRIHGTVMTCGASTRRMTHSSPNTANIPKAKDKVPYGKECRQLWTVDNHVTRRLVGYDAKGLEMRMFAHYLDNPEAAELYINGDPHQVNADLLGIDRDPVKNVFYAFLYGAMDPKLGWTADTSLVKKADQRRRGAEVRELLIAKTPGLQRLVDQVKAEGEYIRTIDGGLVRCEAEHARINYKLQSAGAIVMKQASIFLDERIQELGYDAIRVGDIHDEGQLDCDARCADEVGKLATQCLIDAGRELNFRVPIEGDYKVGLTWADTH
jgi:DNA polymerase-1